MCLFLGQTDIRIIFKSNEKFSMSLINLIKETQNPQKI